jgi:hypothetical protein
MHLQLVGPSADPADRHQHRPFLTKLVTTRFPPDTIDFVVYTYLHGDHVGWNTRLLDGEWIPMFPEAHYLFGASDIECCSHSSDPLHASSFADSVQPVIDADPDAARTIRRALLAAASMVGTHFTGTAAGRILSTDQSYRFAPQP